MRREPAEVSPYERGAHLFIASVYAAEAPQAGALRARGAALEVAPDDLDGFAERAMAELLNLHEGSASRYQHPGFDPSRILAIYP